MSLSICLLTRDAEQTLERALRSVASLQAEIIVGDTGSRDGTVAVARAAGATVVDIPWQEDFGSAQNATLAVASGDWVFWLNPDEEFVSTGPQQLAALLARPEVFAYVVRVQELMKADSAERPTELAWPRLFRRHPDVRFIGRLHPHFATPLEEIAQRQQLEIFHSDLVVRHHAYLSVLTEAKLRWASRLLELELRDRPGQLHYLIEYGRTLLRLDDPRGHTVLAEAADLVLAVAEAPAAPTSTVASLLEYLLTVAPGQSVSRLAPEQACQLARRWFFNSPPLVWRLAQRAFEAANYREAAGLLEHLVSLGKTAAYDRSAAFDPALVAESALLNLGHCYLRLGELGRAESCFAPLLSNTAYQAQAWQGYGAVQARRAGRSEPRAQTEPRTQ